MQGGLLGCIQLGNGMRGCVVVAGQEGTGCGTGLGTGGQYQLVLIQGVSCKWWRGSQKYPEVGVARQRCL